MDETCRLRRGDGYGDCIDEAAKQEKGLRLSCCAPWQTTSARSAGSFGRIKTALFCGCQNVE